MSGPGRRWGWGWVLLGCYSSVGVVYGVVGSLGGVVCACTQHGKDDCSDCKAARRHASTAQPRSQPCTAPHARPACLQHHVAQQLEAAEARVCRLLLAGHCGKEAPGCAVRRGVEAHDLERNSTVSRSTCPASAEACFQAEAWGARPVAKGSEIEGRGNGMARSSGEHGAPAADSAGSRWASTLA